MTVREYVERSAAAVRLPLQETIEEYLKAFGFVDVGDLTMEEAGELWKVFCR